MIGITLPTGRKLSISQNLIFCLLPKCETLVKFRQQAYELLGPAKDATFELLDAVMTTPKAKCLADFWLNPLFRRQW